MVRLSTKGKRNKLIKRVYTNLDKEVKADDSKLKQFKPDQNNIANAKDNLNKTVLRNNKSIDKTDNEKVITEINHNISKFIMHDNTTQKDLSKYFIPLNYEQAITCSEKENWIKAMDEEMNSIHYNNTWELCELPNNKENCKN